VTQARLPIGVTLGTLGVTAGWWLDAAARLDAAGYRAIWTWDHLMSKGDRSTPVLEAWTLLSAASARTNQAYVGSFVLNVMNRHPAVLARMASTLQAVSGGRLRLGIGIGGHPREHEAYGIEFPPPVERAARLREAVAVLRALWAGGPAAFEGRSYRLADAWARPIPDPMPPILVGAGTPAGVRLAAEVGDGWAAEEDGYERLRGRWLEALEAAGRRREEQLVVVGIAAPGRSGEPALEGSPFVARPREAWEEWMARGADEVTLTARTTADVDALVEASGRW
jgi:alkanesulfonate monooxygenase SsuD/methylene tetrahydromethanopterin reductase-like flavin-dependent oxidoreductase (luciferase family)